MRAGRLRHRVEIQRPTEEIGATGQRETVWVNHAHVWASITQITARETQYAEQTAPRATTQVEMRYRSDLDASYRLVVQLTGGGTRVLNIEGIIDPSGYRRMLRLFCMEEPINAAR